MKKLLVLASLLVLAACNTIQGAGEDLRGAGQGISHAAEKVKESL